jgi:hypothetical protein
MEAFSATLERQLQLTVRMLDQAVRTPSGILVILLKYRIGTKSASLESLEKMM